MAYPVLHGLAPEYLNQLVLVSDMSARRRLRSSSTLQLLIPPLSSVNYWPSIVSCLSIHLLEHSSSRCTIITFRLNFLPTAKVISVPPGPFLMLLFNVLLR